MCGVQGVICDVMMCDDDDDESDQSRVSSVHRRTGIIVCVVVVSVCARCVNRKSKVWTVTL